ncbi:HEPN domain-containing protein [Candidatus Parcubacteria bacterium]|nr:HEPN domain-containing protein [Candidatus Parcubacteria bacterium]
MNQENIKKIIKYWQKTANHDYKTMIGLFKIKRYSDSLFFGHITLEKILKGLVVKETKNEAPYIHNLTKLAELANCDLSDNEMDLLDAVNKFNIKCRYPEHKLQFYKMCDKKYTKKYLAKIINLYKKLCEKLKQKK